MNETIRGQSYCHKESNKEAVKRVTAKTDPSSKFTKTTLTLDIEPCF